LSRSKTAAEANKSLADSKLESKARAQIKTEKRALLEKGRVKDVLGLENENVATGAVMEEEKRLKKTAQRGVVKLFNAVRAAQVKAAMKAAKEDGVVGLGKREERMNEMSKQGFLDLISSGGKPTAAA
jgi:fusion and transport protein UGO1